MGFAVMERLIETLLFPPDCRQGGLAGAFDPACACVWRLNPVSGLDRCIEVGRCVTIGALLGFERHAADDPGALFRARRQQSASVTRSGNDVPGTEDDALGWLKPGSTAGKYIS